MPTEHIFFSGRVQGVGFRATLQGIAKNLPITGYVRNLPDGRVEAVVQGEADALENLLRTVELRLPGHLRQIDRRELTSGEGFQGFEIRY
jgi:acylphosphatase